MTTREQLAVLVSRVDTMITKVDNLETRLTKQEHWRSYMIGAGTALGGLVGWLVGTLGH